MLLRALLTHSGTCLGSGGYARGTGALTVQIVVPHAKTGGVITAEWRRR